MGAGYGRNSNGIHSMLTSLPAVASFSRNSARKQYGQMKSEYTLIRTGVLIIIASQSEDCARSGIVLSSALRVNRNEVSAKGIVPDSCLFICSASRCSSFRPEYHWDDSRRSQRRFG